MAKRSAGIVLYRQTGPGLEVFLVHPGGPLWAKKDLGAWSIPKGQIEGAEDPLMAARREFEEETGFPAEGDFLALGTFTQASGKQVWAWALEGDCDPAKLKSNLCQMAWPPRSGRMIEFPEVDRGAWFPLREAHDRILTGQRPILLRFEEIAGPRSR
jgi:predicted NUDIX family NTP pyrophosphohydrolase